MKQKAILWAEYVLPIWQKYYPYDDRPQKAIEVAKTGDDTAYATDAAFAAASNATAYAAASVAYATAYAAASAAAAYAADRAAHVAVATNAAFAVYTEGYGDQLKVKKARLLKLEFPREIEWLEYKPEQFWDVLLGRWTL